MSIHLSLSVHHSFILHFELESSKSFETFETQNISATSISSLRGIAPGRSEAALELGVRQALECHEKKTKKRCGKKMWSFLNFLNDWKVKICKNKIWLAKFK